MKDIIYLSIVDMAVKNGQGIYALQTFKSFLSKKNVNLTLICPKPTKENVILSLENHDTQLIYLRQKNKNRNVFWHLFIQVQLLLILLRFGKKDAIVYSLKPTMFAPLIYSFFYRVPIYLLLEGLSKKTMKLLGGKFVQTIGSFLLNMNIKFAERVYPAYLSAKEWVDSIRGYNRNSTVIHCGVDTNIFKPFPKKSSNNKLTIGYVGSFRKCHLLYELIESIKRLDVRLMLVGRGKEYKELKSKVEHTDLIAEIQFLGEKEQNELPDFFSECNVMWGAVDINNWGVAIKCFEYLACNKKVIFTYRKDFEFIIDRDYGYMLHSNNPKDIESLILKIKGLFEKGYLADNVDSSDYIKQNNRWDRFASSIICSIRSQVRNPS